MPAHRPVRIIDPERLLALCLSAQTDAHRCVQPSDDHETTLLSRAQEWMRRAPHELSKAKTWAAKVNAIRPLCEQRVAVEPTVVVQHLLEHGQLEMRDGKLRLTQVAFDAGKPGPLLPPILSQQMTITRHCDRCLWQTSRGPSSGHVEAAPRSRISTCVRLAWPP